MGILEQLMVEETKATGGIKFCPSSVYVSEIAQYAIY